MWSASGPNEGIGKLRMSEDLMLHAQPDEELGCPIMIRTNEKGTIR